MGALATVNAKSKDGWTATWKGARGGHLEVVRILVSKGADSNIADVQGKKAIDLARPHIKPFFELTLLDITDPKVMVLLSENDYLLWFLMISVDFTSKLVSDLITEYPELVDVMDTTGKYEILSRTYSIIQGFSINITCNVLVNVILYLILHISLHLIIPY